MPTARVTPPRLDDASMFTKMEKVPVFKSHVRRVTNKETKQSVMTKVDDAQLSVICNNTNNRINKGEFPLITIGHRDFTKPETDQPPLVGFLGQHEIGEYNGEKAILADMYIFNDKKDKFLQYPRRSSEVFSKESPFGYIDSLAVLKRPPELDLGMITHFQKKDIEIFECEDCEENVSKEDDEDGVGPEDDGPDDPAETESEDDPGPGPDNPDETPEAPAEENDDDSSNDSVGKLGDSIGGHVANHLSSNKEFISNVAKVAASEMASDPKLLDALIKRMGDLLENRNGSDSQPIGDHTQEDEEMPEKYENDVTPQPDKVRIGLLETQLEEAKSVISTLRTENSSLISRIDSIENYTKELQATNRKNTRRIRLQGIHDKGIRVDVDNSLTFSEDMSDDKFEMFAKHIEENHSRVPESTTMITTQETRSRPEKPEKTEISSDLTEEEFSNGAVEMFAKENNIDMNSTVGAVQAVKEYLKRGDRSKYATKK